MSGYTLPNLFCSKFHSRYESVHQDSSAVVVRADVDGVGHSVLEVSVEPFPVLEGELFQFVELIESTFKEVVAVLEVIFELGLLRGEEFLDHSELFSQGMIEIL